MMIMNCIFQKARRKNFECFHHKEMIMFEEPYICPDLSLTYILKHYLHLIKMQNFYDFIYQLK
jgi:hypothetical protein